MARKPRPAPKPPQPRGPDGRFKPGGKGKPGVTETMGGR